MVAKMKLMKLNPLAQRSCGAGFAACLALVLVGCVSGGADRPHANRKYSTMSAEQAKAVFVGKTIITHDASHGTQVTYLGRDGTGRLWYPGNKVVLSNQWRIEEGNPQNLALMRGVVSEGFIRSSRICFKYGSNTINLHARMEVSGQFNCGVALSLANRIIESADGDVFGLSKTHSVPFVLSPSRTTITELKSKLPSSR